MKPLLAGLLITTLMFLTTPVEASFPGIYGDRLDCLESCEKQFKELKRYARKGSPRAQTLLDVLYKTGEMEVTPNKTDAWRWMKRANRQRFAPAQFHMSRWYREGFRTEVDVEKADDLLSRSAEQGYIPARFEWAIRLVEKGDLDTAVEYMNEAYDAKYPLALALADFLDEQKAKSTSSSTAAAQNASMTSNTVLEDRPGDENTIVVYGSKEQPELLYAELLQDIKDMGVYDERGATGSRLGDTKCGERGSGCKAYRFDAGALSYYDLNRLIYNRRN